MMPFLTVKEASQLTGKSTSSIRRIIYPILRDDAHPDRKHVEPSPEEAVKLRLKGENFAWRLSEELLRREISTDSRADKGFNPASTKTQHNSQDDLLVMLRRELETKNEQIANQADLLRQNMTLMNSLHERLHEGNVLIASLQQRLALTDAKPITTVADAAIKPESATTPKKGGTILHKPPKKKRGFFSRLFR